VALEVTKGPLDYLQEKWPGHTVQVGSDPTDQLHVVRFELRVGCSELHVGPQLKMASFPATVHAHRLGACSVTQGVVRWSQPLPSKFSSIWD
jgi:hypothetical protein